MRKSLAAIALVTLAACGGGGGSTGTSMQLQSAPAPVEPFSVPVTALIGVNAYFLSYSETPNAGTAAFAGQTAHSSTRTLNVSDGNSTIAAQNATEYYLENPYTPLGETDTSVANPYELIFNSVTPLPAVLTVSASGPLYSGTYYAPGTHTVIGSLTATYAVTAYNSTQVELSITDTGTLNGLVIFQVVSYAVDASGNLSLVSMQLTVSGVSLFFNLPAP